MTAKEYQRAVEHLDNVQAAPALMGKLRIQSPTNEMYVAALLKKYPLLVQLSTPAVEATIPDPEESPVSPDDETERELTRKIGNAYGTLRATRNRFHGCSTPAQYAEVNKAVQQAWRQVLAAIEKRTQYRNTGAVLDPEAETALPDNPVELMKHINSLRAINSQTKNAILKAAAESDSAKVDELEAKLKRNKARLERAVEKANISE